MRSNNSDNLESKLPTNRTITSVEGSECLLLPDNEITKGIQVQREHILSGTHKHNSAPIIVIGVHDGRASKLIREIGSRKRAHIFADSDIEISPPDNPHSQTTYDRSTEQIFIGVETSVISNIAETSGIDSHQVQILELFGQPDPVMQSIARRFAQEQQAPGLGGRLYIEALATELAIHFLRKYTTLRSHEKSKLDGIDSTRLKHAIERIHDDLHADLSLKELAESVQLSPHHFSRVFKNVTGFSPHQYVLQQRVNLAERLLAETTLSLAEVADRVGFYDQSHFNLHFKRLSGVTPKTFREVKNIPFAAQDLPRLSISL